MRFPDLHKILTQGLVGRIFLGFGGKHFKTLGQYQGCEIIWQEIWAGQH